MDYTYSSNTAARQKIIADASGRFTVERGSNHALVQHQFVFNFMLHLCGATSCGKDSTSWGVLSINSGMGIE